jgi:hypothetical protein
VVYLVAEINFIYIYIKLQPVCSPTEFSNSLQQPKLDNKKSNDFAIHIYFLFPKRYLYCTVVNTKKLQTDMHEFFF